MIRIAVGVACCGLLALLLWRGCGPSEDESAHVSAPSALGVPAARTVPRTAETTPVPEVAKSPPTDAVLPVRATLAGGLRGTIEAYALPARLIEGDDEAESFRPSEGPPAPLGRQTDMSDATL